MVVFEGYQCEIAWATNDKFETLILIVPLFSKGTRHQALLGPRCPAAPAPSTACSQRSIIRAEGPAVRAAAQALALSHKGLDTQYSLLSGWISRFSDFSSQDSGRCSSKKLCFRSFYGLWDLNLQIVENKCNPFRISSCSGCGI